MTVSVSKLSVTQESRISGLEAAYKNVKISSSHVLREAMKDVDWEWKKRVEAQRKRDEAAKRRDARGPMAERILGFIVIAFPSLIGMFLSRGMDGVIAAIAANTSF